jgi:hypothetical protein
VISSEATLARNCSTVRAPMSVEVTAGRLRTQVSATSAEPTSISDAIRATASMTAQSRSVGPPLWPAMSEKPT